MASHDVIRDRDVPRPTLSDRLADPVGADPVDCFRHDGWTEDRIRVFLHRLAQCGTVNEAARAAGMSRQSAYALRNGTRGRGFRVAWAAALRLSRDHLVDLVHSRVVHGCVELIVRDGQVVAERHRFDNRLTMEVIGRLDRLAEGSRSTGLIAEDFEAFVEMVAADDQRVEDYIEASHRYLPTWPPEFDEDSADDDEDLPADEPNELDGLDEGEDEKNGPLA